MASSIWEDLKKTLKDGVHVAAEKTEEYTRIGRIKVDILNQTRTKDKTYKALGREVYTRVSDGKKVDPHKDDGIRYFIDKISDLESSIREKELSIAAIKEEAKKKTADAVDQEPEEPIDDSPIDEEKAE
jgi:hypothetical protein